MRKQRFVLLAIATAVAVALAGCGDDDDEPGPLPTAGTTAVATATGGPTSEASASAPLIAIDAPAAGELVSVPVAASGTANTFEAALTVDLLDADGNELCVRHIMATSGTGTPGTWETELAIVPPDAEEAATLRAYEFSAKDGSVVNLVERDVTISTERPRIFFSEPACGAVVAPGSTLAVSGRAMVFEAALIVELRNAFGAVVLSQNVMAESGVEEADFSAQLALPADLPGGFYDVVAYNTSAMDGSIENEFAVQISVGG